VYWYTESRKSAVTVQSNYRLVYRKTPPSVNSIKNWCEKFFKIGSVQYHLMLTDDLFVYYPKHCQSSRIFHTRFNGVHAGWCFPVLDDNYAERLPLIFLIQHTCTNTGLFSEAVVIFYGRCLKKNTEITIFFSL
jgi:hypothetical protein